MHCFATAIVDFLIMLRVSMQRVLTPCVLTPCVLTPYVSSNHFDSHSRQKGNR